jgi:hypothetical protein
VKQITAVIAALVVTAACQTKTSTPTTATTRDSVVAVDGYCRSIGHFIASNDAKKLTFGRQCSITSQYPHEPPSCTWKQFANEAAWQHWTENIENENWGAAFVWPRDGKPVQANFTFQSPSYDWTNLANYCFRPDGTIAVMTTTLNDLNLDVSFERVTVYSRTGERLQVTETARKLSTNKRTRIPEELVKAEKEDSSSSGFRAPAYRTVRELPFFNMTQQ